MKYRIVAALTAALLASGCTCSESGPTPEELRAAARKDKPKPKKEGKGEKADKTAKAGDKDEPKPKAGEVTNLRLRPLSLGQLDGTSSADVESLGNALPAAYHVAEDDGAAKVTKDGRHVMTIFRRDGTDVVGRAHIYTRDISAPRGVRVGTRIGEHHNWADMSCTAGTGEWKGKAICQAFEEGRIQFVVGGDEAVDGVPAREVLARLAIDAMVWNPAEVEPTEGGGDKKPEGGGEDVDQGGQAG